MKASIGRGGSEGSIQKLVLGFIVEEQYDDALQVLEQHIDSKPEYPDFKKRSERLIQYSIELVRAIKTKRSFPGWDALNMSKQKELFEKSLEHFDDLKTTLQKIETIETEVRMEDVRSTVWVIRVLVYAVSALLFVVFVKEMTGGVLPAANTVLESTTNQMVDFAFDKLGL